MNFPEMTPEDRLMQRWSTLAVVANNAAEAFANAGDKVNADKFFKLSGDNWQKVYRIIRERKDEKSNIVQPNSVNPFIRPPNR